MTLNTVTLKWDLSDLMEAGISATLSITPTAQLSDTTDHILIPPVARSVTFSGGTGQLAGIVANDNSALQPAGSGYLISVTSQQGKVLVAQFQTQLNFANGATQWLDELAVVPVVATSYQYLPLPTGTPQSGQVPVATGTGEGSAWGTIAGGVTSFNTRTGAVVPQSGDYTAAQVGLTAYPDQLPALEYSLTGGTGLTRLYAAIANRDNARVDIPVIGDSITEGYGATTFTNRWIAQASRAIRGAFPTLANGSSGGLGFIPIQESGGLASYTWPVTVSGGDPGAAFIGPVRFSTFCVTPGVTWAWTAPAGTTSVKIMYFDLSAAGSFTYQVNSGSTTTVSNAGAALDILTSPITMTGGDVLTIAYVSGEVALDGLMHYAGDEAGGITFDGCGHYGWAVTDWDGHPGTNWFPAFNTFTPSAFGIMLGVNDAPEVDAPAFQSNLETFMTNLRTNVTGGTPMVTAPCLMIACYDPNETVIDPGGWPAYVTAMRAALAADTIGGAVIDLSYRMPAIASDWDGGILYHDAFHPSNLGHALIGEIAGAAVRIA